MLCLNRQFIIVLEDYACLTVTKYFDRRARPRSFASLLNKEASKLGKLSLYFALIFEGLQRF